MFSDSEILGLQPNVRPDGSYTEKPYRVGCGKGLFILVNPNGSKYWRFKYRYDGKQKSLSFGVFPEVGIEAAISKRDEYRAMLKERIDPSTIRKKYKTESLLAVQAEKMASRFLYSENGNLMIKLGGREMLLSPEDARDLKKFLNTYPTDEV